MHLLAATAVEILRQMPPSAWAKIGLAIAVFIALVLVLRKLARMNKVVLGVIVVVSLSIVFFSWVYNRNEPKFLTPVVEKIAPFFPSAGSYAQKQQAGPKH